MANTFELIESVTVGSGGAANIDFTSIPATFTDLCLKYSTRSTSAGDDYLGQYIKFNTATSSFTYRHLYGTGSAAGSANGSTNLGSYTQGGLTTATLLLTARFTFLIMQGLTISLLALINCRK
jgi:hypothetical protein